MKMKCWLFNDPFDNYGHIGSGNGSGELRSGWVGSETMKDDIFLRPTRNPWTAISRTRTTNLQIYSSARYHTANLSSARYHTANLTPFELRFGSDLPMWNVCFGTTRPTHTRELHGKYTCFRCRSGVFSLEIHRVFPVYSRVPTEITRITREIATPPWRNAGEITLIC